MCSKLLSLQLQSKDDMFWTAQLIQAKRLTQPISQTTWLKATPYCDHLTIVAADSHHGKVHSLHSPLRIGCAGSLFMLQAIKYQIK
eukprot:1161685-Pelagomonas_calceolata.AAC.24